MGGISFIKQLFKIAIKIFNLNDRSFIEDNCFKFNKSANFYLSLI